MDENAARRRQLGRRGEDLVATWYEKRGYQVVARNWACRAGELDIVAYKGSQYIFCEVKTRSSGAFGLPVEAVDGRKQARLRRLAAMWLAALRDGAVPDSAVPDSAVPDSAVPDSAVPDSAVPDNTGRDAASHGGVGGFEGSEQRSSSGWSQIGPASRARARPSRGHFDLRFDVASVLAGVVEVTEEAF